MAMAVTAQRPAQIVRRVLFLLLNSIQLGNSLKICRWDPYGSLVPQGRSTCPHAVGHEAAPKTSQWAPWSYPPHCARLQDSPPSTQYCLYTYSSAGRYDSVSILTTPEIAAENVHIFEDAASRWASRTQFAKPSLPDTTDDDDSIYEVEDIPGKGKGVIASRRIRRGEVIMVEFPKLLVNLEFLKTFKPPQRQPILQKAVEQLPDSEAIFSLAQSTGGHQVEDVMRTNTFTVPVSKQDHISLFPRISRINHACKPNSFTRFSRETMFKEIVAVRDIEPGEEVTITYTPLGLTHKDRNNLLRNWGFQCTCSLCSSPDERDTSDTHRMRISRIWNGLEIYKHKNKAKVVELTRELLKLLDVEELTVRVGEFYEKLAKIYLDMGHIKGARKFGRLALKYWEEFDSIERDHVKEVLGFLQLLEKR